MEIKQLKKEIQLSNTKIAVFFDLTLMAFANIKAKINRFSFLKYMR